MKPTFNIFALALLGISLSGLSAQTVLAQELSIAEMSKLLPDSTNCMMVVNVNRIKQSKVARDQGWDDTFAGKVTSGLVFLPGDANVVMLGASMDYDTFDPRQSAVLATMKTTPSVDMIRQVTDGYVDVIEDMEVVATPEDHFVAPIDSNLVASLRPALRPEFSRWLRALKKGKATRIPNYLEEGIGYADELGTEVIVAFNLADVLSRSSIKHRIDENELVRQYQLNPEATATQIASVRGFTLGITVRNKIYGAIKYDFAEDISALKPLARQVAMGICERSGVHLDDFRQWKVETTSHQIKLSGELSVESFRKILSTVDAPYSYTTEFASRDDSGYDEYIDPLTATKRYFESVNSFVAQSDPKISSGSSYTRNANWLRRYADKIDSMPTLYVDEEMIDYGNYVSQILRESSLMLINARETAKQKNQTLIASGARSGGAYGGRYGYRGGYRYGRWGNGYYYRSGGDGSRLRRAVRYKEKSEAIKAVAQAFEEIATERRDVRQSMTRKYQHQF